MLSAWLTPATTTRSNTCWTQRATGPTALPGCSTAPANKCIGSGKATRRRNGLRALPMRRLKPFAGLRTCIVGRPAEAKVSWVGCSHPSMKLLNLRSRTLPGAWASSYRPIPWPVRRSPSVCCMKLPIWPVRPVTVLCSWWGFTVCWPA
ncbi:hypothetical protein D3C87_1505770 [compost metagenome]